MVAIPSRHKSLVLLTGAVLLQVLLLAVQIKSDTRGSLIRVWTVTAISPFERAGAWCIDGVKNTWHRYFALRDTELKNENLRRQNDQLKLEVNQLQSKAGEADRLAALLNFRDAHKQIPMLAARVIGGSADNSSQAVYLDRGQRDGIERNMAVITPDGVVGKIIAVFNNESQVLLLTDKESGVGAMLADTRVQYPVGGAGGKQLMLKYVPNDDPVNLGDKVVTSGMDRIYPKDLPVGTITQIKPNMPFKEVTVKPAAAFDHLEDVIVLLTMQPLAPKNEPEAQAPANAAKPLPPPAAQQ
jgi:rod shape-determining protein MreC